MGIDVNAFSIRGWCLTQYDNLSNPSRELIFGHISIGQPEGLTCHQPRAERRRSGTLGEQTAWPFAL